MNNNDQSNDEKKFPDTKHGKEDGFVPGQGIPPEGLGAPGGKASAMSASAPVKVGITVNGNELFEGDLSDEVQAVRKLLEGPTDTLVGKIKKFLLNTLDRSLAPKKEAA